MSHINSPPTPTGAAARAKQLVHSFLGGKGLGIEQGMIVWVGLPKSWCSPLMHGFYHHWLHLVALIDQIQLLSLAKSNS